MSEQTFEELLIGDIKRRLLSEISKADFLKVEYGNRKTLPNEFIQKAWASIDWDKVIEDIKPEIHRRICNAIVGNMETEIKTDVKNVMCIDGVRQRLRAEAYPKIMEVLSNDTV